MLQIILINKRDLHSVIKLSAERMQSINTQHVTKKPTRLCLRLTTYGNKNL